MPASPHLDAFVRANCLSPGPGEMFMSAAGVLAPRACGEWVQGGGRADPWEFLAAPRNASSEALLNKSCSRFRSRPPPCNLSN
jgi:hypothetical protein